MLASRALTIPVEDPLLAHPPWTWASDPGRAVKGLDKWLLLHRAAHGRKAKATVRGSQGFHDKKKKLCCQRPIRKEILGKGKSRNKIPAKLEAKASLF